MLDVVTKSRDSLLITAPVLVPNEKDCEFNFGEEPLTPEEIQDMAHSYLANYGLVDKNHEFFKTREVIGLPVESYITQEPISLKSLDGEVREYPTGTWIVTTKITDQDEIKKALDGEYNGYSVTTISKKFADKQIQLPKRVLMKDIPDPVGFTVSLVKNPCVKSAKFCSMKNDNGVVMSDNLEEQIETETKGFLQSIKGIINKDDKDDKNSKADTKNYVTVEDFEAFKKELKQDVDKSLETVNTTVKSVDEAVQNINSALDSLKHKEDEEEEEEEDEKTTKKVEEGNAEETDDEVQENNDNSQNVQSSKSIPNHDIKNKTSTRRTGSARVYELMGRDSTGSALRKQ